MNPNTTKSLHIKDCKLKDIFPLGTALVHWLTHDIVRCFDLNGKFVGHGQVNHVWFRTHFPKALQVVRSIPCGDGYTLENAQ